MKRLRMISDGALARLRQGATEAWRRQDYPEYFRIMEQASRQDPANPTLLLDMGAAYGTRYEYAEAERCFEKAVRVSPNRSDTLIMAGTQCRGFDRYEMARNYFERAVKEPRVSPDTYVKLAEVYERFRLLEEASSLVDQALHLNPACALACVVGARLYRLSGRVEAAERRLRPLLSQSGRDTWSTRIRGWYELGTVLDAQGRYDEAMAAFLEAKAMILPGAAQFIAAQKVVHSRLKTVAEKIDSERVARWLAQEAGPQPPRRLALLCGHPRSGTTLLEQVLDSHPDFISAEETAIFLRESYVPLLRGSPPETLMLDVLDAASLAALRQARQNYEACIHSFNVRAVSATKLVRFGRRSIKISDSRTHRFSQFPTFSVFVAEILVASGSLANSMFSLFQTIWVPSSRRSLRAYADADAGNIEFFTGAKHDPYIAKSELRFGNYITDQTVVNIGIAADRARFACKIAELPRPKAPEDWRNPGRFAPSIYNARQRRELRRTSADFNEQAPRTAWSKIGVVALKSALAEIGTAVHRLVEIVKKKLRAILKARLALISILDSAVIPDEPQPLRILGTQ